MISIMIDDILAILPEPLNQLERSAVRQRSVDRSESLFHQGDKTRGLFYLIEGAVQLNRISEAGHSVVMLKARAGDTFAEASLFHDRYHCDAVATESAQIIECSKEAVLMKYRIEPDFALALCSRLAIQIQQTRARLELLSIRSADVRVLQALGDGFLRNSVKSFAEEIGLSPEVVYRSLASLVRRGKVRKLGYGEYEPIKNIV